MTELTLLEHATGDCIVCGKDSTGSKYWMGMETRHWNILRPSVGEVCSLPHSEPLIPEERAMNLFFFPTLCKPFCSAVCAMDWQEQYGSYGQGMT